MEGTFYPVCLLRRNLPTNDSRDLLYCGTSTHPVPQSPRFESLTVFFERHIQRSLLELLTDTWTESLITGLEEGRTGISLLHRSRLLFVSALHQRISQVAQDELGGLKGERGTLPSVTRRLFGTASGP